MEAQPGADDGPAPADATGESAGAGVVSDPPPAPAPPVERERASAGKKSQLAIKLKVLWAVDPEAGLARGALVDVITKGRTRSAADLYADECELAVTAAKLLVSGNLGFGVYDPPDADEPTLLPRPEDLPTDQQAPTLMATMPKGGNLRGRRGVPDDPRRVPRASGLRAVSVVTPETLAEQADVLEAAADGSPMGTYAGMLRVRAKEIREVIRSVTNAVEDGWCWDIVPACGSSRAWPVYSRTIGPATVLRVVKNGMGIEVETDEAMGDPVKWINPLSPTSPIVVLNGLHPEPDEPVCDDPECESRQADDDPMSDVMDDHYRYGVSQT